MSWRRKVSEEKPKTKRLKSNTEVTNLIWLASIYGNVDYIDCKDHKIAFSGKREIAFVTLSSLRAFYFLSHAIHF